MGTGFAIRRRVLVAADQRNVDSVTAARRVAAHLTDVDVLMRTEDGHAPPGEDSPDAALVCDDIPLAEDLARRQVPVVFLSSSAVDPETWPDGVTVRCRHRPAWLPSLWDGVTGVGTMAPARLRRTRDRDGVLALVSLAGGSAAEARRYVGEVLRPVVDTWRRRWADEVLVVGDAHLDALADGLGGLDRTRVRSVAEIDVDDAHAKAGQLLATPTLTAATLAWARRAPVVLLPPANARQERLVAALADPWGTPAAVTAADLADAPTPGGLAVVTGSVALASDDLRGAQRVARQVRQVTFAPV
ncbi:CGA synthase-related protein [Streptoalloteichus hindustanus]|uniref:CGA synthase-related protein n=1 Tax=Streptoalloteichus hindustanus TaxID=2017 RepID=A0A1M5F9Y3_STRHI|nr:CGA synthase-related protein [Streptoalloteichus hindustanus]SHF87881.1 CGA synthase-related protein [Streptoalloteichus hindustanus]